MSELDRDQLDRICGLLRDPAVWASPPSELADAIVDRIVPEPVARRRPKLVLIGGLAAAVLVVVGGLAIAARLSDPAPSGDRQVALVGTDLAPAASGRASLDETPSGVALSVRIDGLSPAPDGSYYQAWVAGPNGSVPIGTFHLRGDDGEPIELWSGVDIADYPTLTVTLEPEDGDPASSGQKVLTAELGCCA